MEPKPIPKPSPLTRQPMPEEATLPSPHRASKEVEIIPEFKDLESDEAVSSLYHRWCLHYNISRTPEETDERLDIFRQNAVQVFEMNQMDPSCQFHLSSSCDEKDLFDSSGHEETTLTPTEKDLESDEAVWDLYYRWCIHHMILRTTDQMRQRFDNFKTSTSYAVKPNQQNHPSSNSCLSIWSDKMEIRYSSGVDETTLAPTDKDMESDEALWDLYRRWRDHHKIHRTPEETKLAFKSFKKAAAHAFEMSQRDSTVRFCLSSWCDETVIRFHGVRTTPTERDLKSGNALLDLYHRCNRRPGMDRDPEEMQERFHNFKKSAHRVFEKNKEDPFHPFRLSNRCDEEDIMLGEASYPMHVMPTFKDLASDEAVWALYHRWCIWENKPRTPEEMRQRFDFFKGFALRIFERNIERPGTQALIFGCDKPHERRLWS